MKVEAMTIRKAAWILQERLELEDSRACSGRDLTSDVTKDETWAFWQKQVADYGSKAVKIARILYEEMEQ